MQYTTERERNSQRVTLQGIQESLIQANAFLDSITDNKPITIKGIQPPSPPRPMTVKEKTELAQEQITNALMSLDRMAEALQALVKGYENN